MAAESELLSVLGLDPGIVAAVASATENYARRQEEVTAERAATSLVIGSAYTRAAISWCLLDPKRAQPLFRRVAEEYRKIGRPRATCFEILGSPREPRPTVEVQQARLPKDLPDVQAIVLAIAWRAVIAAEHIDDELSWLLDGLSAVGARPTGRLRLPLRLHLAIARDSVFDPPALPLAMREVLGRAGDATELLIGGKASLTALRPGILLLDPEVLALSVLATISYQQTVGAELSQAPLDVPSGYLAPLLAARVLIDSGSGEAGADPAPAPMVTG